MAKNEKFNQVIREHLAGSNTLHTLLNEKYKDLKLNINDVVNYIKYNYLSDPNNEVIKSVERLRIKGFVI